MVKRLMNRYAQSNRIRFNQLRTCLCPLCNSIIYFDPKDNAYKCKNEDCLFKDFKVETETNEEQETKSLEQNI